MNSSIWQEAQDAFTQWSSSSCIAFSCEYCKMLYQSEDALFQHVYKVHRVSTEKYTGDNPHYSVDTQGHVCQLCNVVTSKIPQHLDETHHKMAPELYFMRYLFQGISEISGAVSHYNAIPNDDSIHFLRENDNETPWEQHDVYTGLMSFKDQSLIDKTKSEKYEPEDKNFQLPGSHQNVTKYSAEKANSNSRGDKSSLGNLRERNHRCVQCNYSCELKKDLVKHSRTHSGDRPYKCGFCGKAFSDGSNFKKHEKTCQKKASYGNFLR